MNKDKNIPHNVTQSVNIFMHLLIKMIICKCLYIFLFTS